MRLATRFKRWQLKKQARAHYHEYHSRVDELNCGRALAEEVSPRVYQAKVAFNRVMDKLAKIDPTTPADRL